ncbi:energy transducer TonB [Aureivirga sp. CE67]|uniref:energy transducer TonB n=1 Tax=Aureivirga sp. CE67 TaxID=1788983 RepID=UPI0018C93D77|nr:energy transducer TonB [Aureivirga sp. CE67]
MLKTKHEKKSAVLTVLVMLLLLIVVFLGGMKYKDPPDEYGVAINFGTSDVGSGNKFTNETVKTAPKQTVKAPSKPVASKTVEDDVLASDNAEDVPTITKSKDPVKNTTPEKDAPTKDAETPKEEVEQKPDDKTTNLLDNLFNGEKSDGTTSEGDGDDDQPGNKGKENGDVSSGGYKGGANGGGGNYLLSGRKVLKTPKNKPDCTETGTVVIRIEVDASGNVIKADFQVEGSDNSSKCLIEPAIKAAKATKFNEDSLGRNRQVGKIIYQFR